MIATTPTDPVTTTTPPKAAARSRARRTAARDSGANRTVVPQDVWSADCAVLTSSTTTGPLVPIARNPPDPSEEQSSCSS